MSPTFTSLKFEMPMPHSKPARTSFASSLKRLSEIDVAGVNHDVVAQHAHLGVALDDAVLHGAAGDHADALHAEVSRTSARPRYVSLMTGASKPATAFFNSSSKFVDDRVQANVHVFALREVGGFALRAAR